MTPAVIAVNVLLSFINGPHTHLPYDSIYPTCPHFLVRKLFNIKKAKMLEEKRRIEGELLKIREAQRMLNYYSQEGVE